MNRYIDGQHLPDCESQRPPTIEFAGSTITTTQYVCTGCLPSVADADEDQR